MDFPKVTIQIVTWNSSKYLPLCLKSIFDQTFKDFQVLIVDNNSQDGTIDFLRRNYPEVAVFQNKKNFGFAKANNQGIRLLNSPYVLLCNPDVIMEPNWLEKIMAGAEAEEYKNFGSFSGKLLKLKMLNFELSEIEKTDIIDSCGLKILKNHRVVELGAWEGRDNFSEKREAFGHSGSLVLYRREALADTLIKTKNNPAGEYFDEDFFSYKEDVDLAWRLRLFGWPAFLLPDALAYHVRSMARSSGEKIWQIVKHRQRQSKIAKYYSYRNHLSLLLKNEFVENLIKYLPEIFWQEFKKAVYVLFFEWSSIKVWGEWLALAPKMLAKRREIFRRTKLTAEEIRKWIV